MEHIIETWKVSNQMNLYLLSGIDNDWLEDVASSSGRSVGDQFGHIHNVRLMWLKEAAPTLMEGLSKIQRGSTDISSLKLSLSDSSKAIGKLIAIGLEEGKIRGFTPHPTAFLGYIIAHEAHHRGQIVLSLKQSGHQVNKKASFGLWEWGSRTKEINTH